MYCIFVWAKKDSYLWKESVNYQYHSVEKIGKQILRVNSTAHSNSYTI